MTDQEIIDEVADQLGNTQITAKIVRWLNNFVYGLASRYTFPHLYGIASLSATTGTQFYEISKSRMFLRNLWTSTQKLDPKDEIQLTEEDPLWNVTTGEVTHYLLNSRFIQLYRVPASDITVNYSYQKRPTGIILGNVVEYEGFPIEWHDVIAQGGVVKGFKYENNPQYPAALAELRDMIRTLIPSVRRRPDARIVMGSNNKESRLGPATLDPTQFMNP